MLTGAAGTGKTTLIADLAAGLEHDGYCVGRVANSQVDAEDLLRLVGFAFGLHARAFSGSGLMSELAARLSDKCPAGKPAILIIDEAENLAPGALPELCRLTGLTGREAPPLQILLSGRDRVWELLDRSDHAQIRQRILASCRLFPLTLEETRSYIAHMLETGDWNGDPGISGDALRLVHERTGGVPRLISLTLGHLLLHGRLCEVRVLEAQDVESVLAHLGKDHPELQAKSAGSLSLAATVPARLLSSPDVPVPPPSGERKPPSAQWRSSEMRDLPGENAQPTPGGRFQRLGGWDWKWVLAGLSVGALVIYFAAFDFARIDDDRPEPATADEPDRGKAAPIVASGWMDPPVAEGPQMPVALPPAAASIAAGPEILDQPAEGAGAEEPQLAVVEPGPTSAGLEDASGPPDDSLSETPALGQEIPWGTQEAASPVAAETASPDLQAPQSPEVELLLEKAELALSENRLMAPAGDNAYGYYREVLALDPANGQAQAGVQRIIARYRELAQQSLKKGDRADARRYASRGLTLAPRDRQLLAIQRQASRPRVRKAQREAPEAAAAQREKPELLDRIEAWLRSGRNDNSHFLEH